MIEAQSEEEGTVFDNYDFNPMGIADSVKHEDFYYPSKEAFNYSLSNGSQAEWIEKADELINFIVETYKKYYAPAEREFGTIPTSIEDLEKLHNFYLKNIFQMILNGMIPTGRKMVIEIGPFERVSRQLPPVGPEVIRYLIELLARISSVSPVPIVITWESQRIRTEAGQYYADPQMCFCVELFDLSKKDGR